MGFMTYQSFEGYLMPNHPLSLSLYIYIYIWFSLDGFMPYQFFVDYLMPNPLYTYISNIYDLVWLGFMAYQSLCTIGRYTNMAMCEIDIECW